MRKGSLVVLALVVLLLTGFPGLVFAASAEAVAGGAQFPGVDWSSVLNEVIKVLVAAAIPILTLALRKVIMAGFEWLRGYADKYHLGNVFQQAENAVLAMYEKTVKGIQQDFADGKITPEEKAARLAQVKKDAMDMLGGFVKSIPAHLQPYLSSKLGELIEAALSKLKIDGAIPSKTIAAALNPSVPPKASVSK